MKFGCTIELSPLFSPESHFETTGIAPNVVFPTIKSGDRLKIYYGAADQVIALKSLIFNDLIKELGLGSLETTTGELIPAKETSS